MKKVDCNLTIEALIECPFCEDIFDLFAIDSLTDDGYLFKELMSNDGWGKQGWGEIIQCPACKKQITINNVEW